MAALNLIDLEKDKYKNKSIWVGNTTKGSSRGQVVFRVYDRAGGSTSVNVPDTWLPIDLTEMASREQLLSSSDFRGAIRNGMLVLLKEKQAQELMAKRGATDEVQRVRNLSQEVDNERSTRLAQFMDATNSDVLPQGEDTSEAQQRIANAQARSKLHQRIQTAEDVLLEQGEMAVVNRLRPVEGELSALDFIHLRELAEKTGSPDLKDYAQERLAAR